MRMPMWWLRLWSHIAPSRTITLQDTDEVEGSPRGRELLLAQEDGKSWEVAMRCPCGCGDTLELQLIPEAKPHWTLSADVKGSPSLKPSVFRATGCKAHFWLRSGRIQWCD